MPADPWTDEKTVEAVARAIARAQGLRAPDDPMSDNDEVPAWKAWTDDARAALQAMSAAGWVCVPRIPTREMVDAWREDQAQMRSLESSYAALIAAATPPTESA